MTRTSATEQKDPVSVEFRVRYAETDQMGVVYHTNYLIWCEVARTELIRRRFMSYADLEKRGVLLAVADASIRYHSPARYDDLVRVETWISQVRSRTITFEYRVVRDAEGTRPDLLASAKTMLVALSGESRPTTIPADLVEALSG